MENVSIKNCPIRKAFQVLGSKWVFLIILELNTVKRYGEIKRAIPDISEKILIEKLKILEKNNFIFRKNYKTIPPKVEYSLTEKGREVLELTPVLVRIGENINYDTPPNKKTSSIKKEDNDL
jgi:DNA-binding HxlR family transcriptional regulator